MLTQANEAFTQAATRIIREIAQFLPGLLVMLAVLLLAFLLAWIVRAIVHKSLRGIDFDKRVEHWGFSALVEWSPSRSPALLLAKLTFWAIVLFGLLLGMTAVDAR